MVSKGKVIKHRNDHVDNVHIKDNKSTQYFKGRQSNKKSPTRAQRSKAEDEH
jgi:hypothetical protein